MAKLCNTCKNAGLGERLCPRLRLMSPPDASSETRGSPSPTAQRPTRAPETSLFGPPLRLAVHSAVHRASCVSLQLRFAKHPPQATIHKSTDSLRLPRFRTAALIHSHTHTHTHAISRAGPRNPAVSPAVHDSFCLPRKTMPGHAAGHTIPHAGHVKRTPHARIPTPITRKHARNTSDGLYSPRLPCETHA